MPLNNSITSNIIELLKDKDALNAIEGDLLLLLLIVRIQFYHGPDQQIAI